MQEKHMEYRQYHNLTEAYLSQVNEDTKQEELNEYFNLVKLLRNPKVMKYINRINTADTAAQLSTAADEFEQMDISDPQGDLDGDGIPNIADADVDGDQLVDTEDDELSGGFYSKSGNRVLKIPVGFRGVGAGGYPLVPTSGETVEVPNPLGPIVDAFEVALTELPGDLFIDLLDALGITTPLDEIPEETSIEYYQMIGERFNNYLDTLNEENYQQLNEAFPALLALPSAAALGKAALLGLSTFFTGIAPAVYIPDKLKAREAQRRLSLDVENVEFVNQRFFDNYAAGNAQAIDVIDSILEIIASGVYSGLDDIEYYDSSRGENVSLEGLSAVETPEQLRAFLMSRGITVTELLSVLESIGSGTETEQDYADRRNQEIDAAKVADNILKYDVPYDPTAFQSPNLGGY